MSAYKTGGNYALQPGIASVGQYQMSGHPYITGSGNNGLANDTEHRIRFPTIARSVTVINKDPDNKAIQVSFQPQTGGVGGVVQGFHYIPLDIDEQSITMNVKCKEIYINNHSGATTTYVVFAELTGIPTGSMYVLTGSGITDSKGKVLYPGIGT